MGKKVPIQVVIFFNFQNHHLVVNWGNWNKKITYCIMTGTHLSSCSIPLWIQIAGKFCSISNWARAMQRCTDLTKMITCKSSFTLGQYSIEKQQKTWTRLLSGRSKLWSKMTQMQIVKAFKLSTTKSPDKLQNQHQKTNVPKITTTC